MKKSREETRLTRERILNTASNVFRAKGIGGIGVADMMQEAGLTHGGFYKHFESKEALAKEACEVALSGTYDALSKAVQDVEPEDAIEKLLGEYLSRAHALHPERGCAIAALGSESARSTGPIKNAMEEGVENLRRLIQVQLEKRNTANPEQEADGVLAAMVGGLLLSRIVQSPQRSKDLLKHTKLSILSSIE